MAQEIKFLGKPVRKRNNIGQFTRQGKSPLIALFIIAIGIGLMYFVGQPTLAMVDDIMQKQNEIYVKAEVSLDCTSPTHINTEQCAKKLTDEVARTWAELKEIESEKSEIDTMYDEKFKAHNLSVCYLERYRGISFEDCEK